MNTVMLIKDKFCLQLGTGPFFISADVGISG
jgi:hypothetical protein